MNYIILFFKSFVGLIFFAYFLEQIVQMTVNFLHDSSAKADIHRGYYEEHFWG